MKTNRPVFVSAVVTWFFLFHVVEPFAQPLMLAIDLAKAYFEHGYGAFITEYTVRMRETSFSPLILASFLLACCAGAWHMRNWGMIGLLCFMSYRLFLQLTSEDIGHWSVLTLLICMFGCSRYFYFKPARKDERPEIHIYEGPVATSSHEPKSAIDDIIY